MINKKVFLFVAFEYIGCFKDDRSRDLKYVQRHGFTVETCQDECKNYKYFAIQHGSWCSCDDTYSTPPETYTKQPDSECPNGKGGGYRNSIYSHANAGK